MPDQSASSMNCATAFCTMSPRHSRAWSSSARRPIESSVIDPAPHGSLERVHLAAARPRRRRGCRAVDSSEKPQMSASSTPTRRPVSARATARLAVIDDLPTPPLPEAIIRTGVCVGIEVDGARAWAMRAGSLHEGGLGAGVEHAHDEFDVVDVVEGEDGFSHVAFDLTPQWAADGRQCDVRRRARPSDTGCRPPCRDSTMEAPSSGSSTWARRSRSRSEGCTKRRYRSNEPGCSSGESLTTMGHRTLEGAPCPTRPPPP